MPFPVVCGKPETEVDIGLMLKSEYSLMQSSLMLLGEIPKLLMSVLRFILSFVEASIELFLEWLAARN